MRQGWSATRLENPGTYVPLALHSPLPSPSLHLGATEGSDASKSSIGPIFPYRRMCH